MSHNNALEAAAEALSDVHDMDVPWLTYAEAAVTAYLDERGLTPARFESLLAVYATGLQAAVEIVEAQPESKEGGYGGNMRIAELSTCREINLKLHKMIEKASQI
jgi:hypothetical protein